MAPAGRRHAREGGWQESARGGSRFPVRAVSLVAAALLAWAQVTSGQDATDPVTLVHEFARPAGWSSISSAVHIEGRYAVACGAGEGCVVARATDLWGQGESWEDYTVLYPPAGGAGQFGATAVFLSTSPRGTWEPMLVVSDEGDGVGTRGRVHVYRMEPCGEAGACAGADVAGTMVTLEDPGADPAAAGSRYGASLAFGSWSATSGTGIYLVVGDPGHSGGRGAIYIFSLDTATGAIAPRQPQSLVPAPEGVGLFGFSLDAFQDAIAIGAPEESATASSRAYFIKVPGPGDETPLLLLELLPEDAPRGLGKGVLVTRGAGDGSRFALDGDPEFGGLALPFPYSVLSWAESDDETTNRLYTFNVLEEATVTRTASVDLVFPDGGASASLFMVLNGFGSYSYTRGGFLNGYTGFDNLPWRRPVPAEVGEGFEGITGAAHAAWRNLDGTHFCWLEPISKGPNCDVRLVVGGTGGTAAGSRAVILRDVGPIDPSAPDPPPSAPPPDEAGAKLEAHYEFSTPPGWARAAAGGVAGEGRYAAACWAGDGCVVAHASGAEVAWREYVVLGVVGGGAGRFGAAVAVHAEGGMAAVGDAGDEGIAGRVHVYGLDACGTAGGCTGDEVAASVQTVEYPGSDGAGGRGFGSAVGWGLAGGSLAPGGELVLVVGDPGHDGGGGAVYVLVTSGAGGDWTVRSSGGVLVPPPEFQGAGFGAALSVFGDHIGVGAPGGEASVAGPGGAFVYVGGEARALVEIENPAPEGGDRFGAAIGLTVTPQVEGFRGVMSLPGVLYMMVGAPGSAQMSSFAFTQGTGQLLFRTSSRIDDSFGRGTGAGMSINMALPLVWVGVDGAVTSFDVSTTDADVVPASLPESLAAVPGFGAALALAYPPTPEGPGACPAGPVTSTEGCAAFFVATVPSPAAGGVAGAVIMGRGPAPGAADMPPPPAEGPAGGVLPPPPSPPPEITVGGGGGADDGLIIIIAAAAAAVLLIIAAAALCVRQRRGLGGDGDLREVSVDVGDDDLYSVPFAELHLVKKLDSGSFKTVYMGRWGGNEVAIATVSMTAIKQEVTVMASLSRHPNLVQMYGLAKDKEKDQTYLVMELVPLGSLIRLLHAKGSKFSEEDRLLVCQQICSGMVALASEEMVHADLAARNVLVQSMDPIVVKVSDFGLSKTSALYYGSDKSTVPVRWSAPEVLRKGKWTEKSDVWAFGVTMWEVFTDGDVPYGLGRANADVESYVKSGGSLPRPNGCPSFAWGMMESCWAYSEDERPSFRELWLILNERIELRPTDASSGHESSAFMMVGMGLIGGKEIGSNGSNGAPLPDGPHGSGEQQHNGVDLGAGSAWAEERKKGPGREGVKSSGTADHIEPTI